MAMRPETRWFLYGIGSALTLVLILWGAWVTITLRSIAFQAARGELAAQWIERQTNTPRQVPVPVPPVPQTQSTTPQDPPK